MEILEKIVTWINTEGEEPAAFGSLHVLFILSVIAFSLILFLRFRDTDDRTFRILIGVMFGVMLLGEILKQTLMNISVEEGKIIYAYNWTDFPFLLCSKPLYVLPYLSFLPDSRLRDFAASYMMTVGLIGGIAVYLTPKTVFGSRVFLNFQTMIHHGIQIIAGVYTAIYYRRRLNRRFYFDGMSVFAVMFVIANLLNTVGYDILLANGLIYEGEAFNMFYISPRADQSVPVLSDFLKSMPSIVYILGYFVFLAIGAFIIMYFVNYVYKESDRRRELRLAKR